MNRVLEVKEKRLMNVLVAGGAGMIGSHLCARLVAEGHHVTCADDLSTGRRKNLAALEGSPRFSFVEHDVIEPIAPRFQGRRFDRVFHLASPASPPHYKRLSLETMRVNSEGTRHLLDLAVRDGARFLYTSTSEAYGDPLEHPQREEYRGNVSSTGPRSMYDEAKRFGEAMVMVYVRTRGANARLVRIFNTYGPNSDPADGRVVCNFIAQALRGEALTLYGDGSQTRSLCYVSDLVEGLLRTIESDATCGEVVNLGNPDEHTVREFAQIIRELAESRSELIFTDYAVGDDPQRRRPDIDKAKRVLGWEPKVPLREGLARTIAYFREELKIPARRPATAAR